MKSARRPPSDRSCSVFVSGLDSEVTEELIWELFIQAGPLRSVTIPKDKVSGRQHPYGFVEFCDAVSVPYSVELLDSIRLFGRPLIVKPQQGSSSRDSGGPGMSRSSDSQQEDQRTSFSSPCTQGSPLFLHYQQGSVLPHNRTGSHEASSSASVRTPDHLSSDPRKDMPGPRSAVVVRHQGTEVHYSPGPGNMSTPQPAPWPVSPLATHPSFPVAPLLSSGGIYHSGDRAAVPHNFEGCTREERGRAMSDSDRSRNWPDPLSPAGSPHLWGDRGSGMRFDRNARDRDGRYNHRVELGDDVDLRDTLRHRALDKQRSPYESHPQSKWPSERSPKESSHTSHLSDHRTPNRYQPYQKDFQDPRTSPYTPHNHGNHSDRSGSHYHRSSYHR